ncbi:MAG: RusA family crossover junction endodeoxyribonuclease [Sphaerochaeta sp.]
MEFSILIGGEPVAQGRPRFTTINGHPRAIDPQKSRESKQIIAQIAREKMAGHPMMEGALDLYLQVYRVPPKSWSNKRREKAINGNLGITSRPDCDNYLKLVQDALNGIIYRDDASIVVACVSKRWARYPGMSVRIVCEERGEA